mgnify:CR=1 FL=1
MVNIDTRAFIVERSKKWTFDQVTLLRCQLGYCLQWETFKLVTYLYKHLPLIWCTIPDIWIFASVSQIIFPDIDTTVSKSYLPKLANNFNHFYLRFEKDEPPYQPAADDITTQTDVPAFTVTEVNAVLKRCIPGKASGPDAIPTKILKACANQLADILCLLFNRCLAASPKKS